MLNTIELSILTKIRTYYSERNNFYGARSVYFASKEYKSQG